MPVNKTQISKEDDILKSMVRSKTVQEAKGRLDKYKKKWGKLPLAHSLVMETLLSTAMQRDDVSDDLVRYLFEMENLQDVKINREQRNLQGYTALHQAIIDKNIFCVKFLLERDFSVLKLSFSKIKNNVNSQSTLFLAAYVGNLDIFNLLYERAEKVLSERTPKSTSLKFFSSPAAAISVEGFSNDEFESTIKNIYISHAAALLGHSIILERLDKLGFDLEPQSSGFENFTPLMFAMLRYVRTHKDSYRKVIEFLLQKNPNIELQNNNKQNFLAYAQSLGSDKLTDIVANYFPDVRVLIQTPQCLKIISALDIFNQNPKEALGTIKPILNDVKQPLIKDDIKTLELLLKTIINKVSALHGEKEFKSLPIPDFLDVVRMVRVLIPLPEAYYAYLSDLKFKNQLTLVRELIGDTDRQAILNKAVNMLGGYAGGDLNTEIIFIKYLLSEDKQLQPFLRIKSSLSIQVKLFDADLYPSEGILDVAKSWFSHIQTFNQELVNAASRINASSEKGASRNQKNQKKSITKKEVKIGYLKQLISRLGYADKAKFEENLNSLPEIPEIIIKIEPEKESKPKEGSNSKKESKPKELPVEPVASAASSEPTLEKKSQSQSQSQFNVGDELRVGVTKESGELTSSQKANKAKKLRKLRKQLNAQAYKKNSDQTFLEDSGHEERSEDNGSNVSEQTGLLLSPPAVESDCPKALNVNAPSFEMPAQRSESALVEQSVFNQQQQAANQPQQVAYQDRMQPAFWAVMPPGYPVLYFYKQNGYQG